MAKCTKGHEMEVGPNGLLLPCEQCAREAEAVTESAENNTYLGCPNRRSDGSCSQTCADCIASTHFHYGGNFP